MLGRSQPLPLSGVGAQATEVTIIVEITSSATRYPVKKVEIDCER